jgi:hypothetical protein
VALGEVSRALGGASFGLCCFLQACWGSLRCTSPSSSSCTGRVGAGLDQPNCRSAVNHALASLTCTTTPGMLRSCTVIFTTVSTSRLLQYTGCLCFATVPYAGWPLAPCQSDTVQLHDSKSMVAVLLLWCYRIIHDGPGYGLLGRLVLA